MPAMKFDWLDFSTHENPSQYEFPNGESVSTPFISLPLRVQDPEPSVNAFVDLAVEKHGIERFILLSGSLLTKGVYYTR